MAIILNDNIKINAGKPSESKYLNSSNLPYSGSTIVAALSAVTTAIPISERYLGLTVLVTTGSSYNTEYWFKTSVNTLVEKKFVSEQLVGDFITGATNLGYFSGQTGIQFLDISGSGFGSNMGAYYSEYQWYYVDSGGNIRIGNPAYGTPYRRGYVTAARDKSWIWNVGTGQWEISLNDIVANVGNAAIISPHTGYVFTGVTFSGSEGTASASTTAYGSLSTGATLTIGYPVYKDKSNQELHLRTIKNETPEFLKIDVDDNFIHFSGVSSVITATNYGTGVGVYSGKTGTNLKFRTLVASGDTTITTGSTGNLIIYSSSDGSANSITGATNYGGGVIVYSGTTNRNLGFNTIVGSGDTTVSKIGSQIVINTQGGGVFANDLYVSIASGKSFGKYVNGDTIPASGKTAGEVIQLALAEALEPTVVLNPVATNIQFGASAKTVTVNVSYTINTLGASVSSILLEWRRGNTGSWSALTTNTGTTAFAHVIYEINRFNTAVINYRYTVNDSAGATKTVTADVTPQAYATPTISPDYDSLNLETYETETLREIGNIITTISGNIISNRSLVNLLTYRIQRNDGSGYMTIASATTINNTFTLISSYQDNSAISSATTITYRVQVDDEWTTTTSSVYTINFRYASYFGYSTNTSLSGAQIVALGNEELLASKTRTVDPVTAPSGNYTYISYPATYGDLTNVIMDDTSPILSAFTKLSNVSVTNFYGETVSNIIYKSNAPTAFTDNKLTFS